MMKTPEEIKKGLECCNTYNDCQQCPYDKADGSWACTVERNADALACIQQLERERDAIEDDKFNYETGFVRGFEAAQPKWISVEERLPEKPGDVLIYLFGAPCVAQYHKDRYFKTVSGVVWWKKDAVTHWMTLPEPPKED